MKNKHETRKQILLRMVNKSHQILEDIMKLTIQIRITQPQIQGYADDPMFVTKLNSVSGKKVDDHRRNP